MLPERLRRERCENEHAAHANTSTRAAMHYECNSNARIGFPAALPRRARASELSGASACRCTRGMWPQGVPQTRKRGRLLCSCIAVSTLL